MSEASEEPITWEPGGEWDGQERRARPHRSGGGGAKLGILWAAAGMVAVEAARFVFASVGTDQEHEIRDLIAGRAVMAERLTKVETTLDLRLGNIDRQMTTVLTKLDELQKEKGERNR